MSSCYKAKGKRDGKAEVVENLILKLCFFDEQAADVTEVSLDFVKRIRAGLARKKGK